MQGLVIPFIDAKTEAPKDDAMCEGCLAKQLNPGLQSTVTFYPLYTIPVTFIQQSLHLWEAEKYIKYNQCNAEEKKIPDTK